MFFTKAEAFKRENGNGAHAAPSQLPHCYFTGCIAAACGCAGFFTQTGVTEKQS